LLYQLSYAGVFCLQKAKPKGYFYKGNISMANIIYYLDLEGNSGKIGTEACFFFKFMLFFNIFDHLQPFFGILNLMTKIATKI
jgi:hypothetical protein